MSSDLWQTGGGYPGGGAYGANISYWVNTYFGLGGTWTFHGTGETVVYGDAANTKFSRATDCLMNVISAMHPHRFSDNCTVFLMVWFEELSDPVLFAADPFDSERHGKELWIRAMAGEFGPVRVVEPTPRDAAPLIKVVGHEHRN